MRRRFPGALVVFLLSFFVFGLVACGGGGGSTQAEADPSVARTASLVGRIEAVSSRSAGRVAFSAAPDTCADVTVSIDPPGAVDLVFDENCELFVTEIPVGTSTITIEVDGIRGAITLQDVTAGEVIEIEVRPGDGSLAIDVLRFVEPDEGPLPEVVNDDNVSIELAAGYFRQTLTVNGDNFELIGEGCSTENEDSTIIAGAVLINGDNAFISGVKFLAPVTVRGGNVEFQGSCFEKGIFIVGDDSAGPDDGTPPTDEPSVCEEVIDFEELRVGTSVEGPGTVHPDLEISTMHGSQNGVAVIGEAREPSLYTAPQIPIERVPNGCLGNPGEFEAEGSRYGQGFGDLDGVHDYVFNILDGKSVSFFEITMLDFGDFNPELVREHSVELVAYRHDDDSRVVIDRDDRFSYRSLGEELPSTPTDPDKGDLQITGDACTAQPGDPGNFTFRVEGAGITHVALLIKTGPDPQIAFDNIRFRLEQVDVEIDVIPTINLKSNGVIPVALLGDACFDVNDVDVRSVEFGPTGARPKHGSSHSEDDWEDEGSYPRESCDDKDHVCDRDGDGDLDLMFHFPTQETGIGPDDTEACLTGMTTDGREFYGCDAIRIAPGSTERKDKKK